MTAGLLRLADAGVGEVLAVDHLRRPLPFATSASGHKEWLHFCVLGDGLDVLVNFSLTQPSGGRPADVRARVSLLVLDGEWDGEVETFTGKDVAAPPGTIDLRFGHSTLRFHDGAYHVAAAVDGGRIAVDLALRPEARPARAPNIPRPDGPPLHWAIVPRLATTGTVTVKGRHHHIDGALAYHDHNWGWFDWGEDFSWRWGFALSGDTQPHWSIAFAFLTDRACGQAFSQGLFLWRGRRVMRAFRDHDLSIRTSRRFLRPRRVLKLPHVMALLAPGLATDVPAWVEVTAQDGADRLVHRFEAGSLVQVVVPSDVGLHAKVLNEVTGTSTVEGVVGGEPIRMAGRSVFEFLGEP